LSIETLCASPVALPAVPKVVQQLILSFSRDDVSVAEIAGQLDADPVLSAKTLRLANSAYFHASRRIASTDDALKMLGFAMVRNLVVGCGMTGAFNAVPGVDLPAFWRYSLHTACAARWLAQATGNNADLAFTVGLVHGLGQLVMHIVLPDAMRPLDAECHVLATGRAALEQIELGYDHGAVSAELAERWKFPAEISTALRAVPAPLRSEPVDAMAALVHIAAWRARIEVLGLDADQAAACCPTAVGRAIGLPIVWLAELGTPGSDHPAVMPPMPQLAELTNGLEVMLE